MRYKSFLACSVCALSCNLAVAQSRSAQLTGKILDENNKPLTAATVAMAGTDIGTMTDDAGYFSIPSMPAGHYELVISMLGYEVQKDVITVDEGDTLRKQYQLSADDHQMDNVEVFGSRNKASDKLDAITRLPLKPSGQIQSISVISDKLIREQGSLTISEAARNVPGVYTYATYGNMRESMSSRGFRGIPVLKNGVRVHSDFRGQGFITDMQGVENIQVLKGANAITMGAANDLGAPGGIINIVTKTPKFYQGGYASLRLGSWGQVRPTFDIFGPVNDSKTLAFRLNGAYERADNYRAGVGLEKFYINPSLEWRPDNKTSFILEMDYLNDNRTPDAGTVNLSTTENEIYDLPFNRNLGWHSNQAFTRNATFAARLKRDISDKLYVRAAYFYSWLDADAVVTSLSQFTNKAGEYTLPSNFVKRSLNHSGDRTDKNSVVQLDLVGQDVKTGFLKHTFQVGMDFRTTSVATGSYKAILIDTVNIFEPVSNKLPASVTGFEAPAVVNTRDVAMGLMAQDVISVTDWAKVFLGGRFSTNLSTQENGTGAASDHTFNPLAGVMISPVKNVNLFASYTNSTNPRSAEYQDVNGNALGHERIDQIEVGLKSDWLNNRLRFNLTVYKINNRNMNLRATETNEAGVVIQLPYYLKGGNDERKGVEVELAGRLLPELEIVAGYAYIDARYLEHTTFVTGSSPNNTPSHTANLWLNYAPRTGALKGFSVGGGAYYISSRPNNDWTQSGVDYHAITPGQAPWYMAEYTILNAQVGYNYKKYGIRLLLNNVLDEVGYNAYRTSFINRIDPRNFAAILTYAF